MTIACMREMRWQSAPIGCAMTRDMPGNSGVAADKPIAHCSSIPGPNVPNTLQLGKLTGLYDAADQVDGIPIRSRVSGNFPARRY